MLTAIEKLDQRIPGVAAQVRSWFDQGYSAQKVSDLLREQFEVHVPRTTIGYFRVTRWVRERELLERQHISELVAQQIGAKGALKESQENELTGEAR
jgi:hypothetical protein